MLKNLMGVFKSWDHYMLPNSNIKYSVHLPLETAVAYEQLPAGYDIGPKECWNCIAYGMKDHIFYGFCTNCVVNWSLPSCKCNNREYHIFCDTCVFNKFPRRITKRIPGEGELSYYREQDQDQEALL